MKLVATILGGLMFLVGCVWIAQGLNVLPGSFMTGDPKWAVFGAILAVAGLVVIVMSRRKAA